MAKRLKFDESGDTDELQALFDSIASEPAQPKLEVVEEQSDDSDSDELQALFDSVAEEFGDSSAGDGAGGGGTGIQMPAEDAAPGSSAAGDKAPGGDAMFNRIGQMTRQLHDALRQLVLGTTVPTAQTDSHRCAARARFSKNTPFVSGS